jgi:hypothetical protein
MVNNSFMRCDGRLCALGNMPLRLTALLPTPWLGRCHGIRGPGDNFDLEKIDCQAGFPATQKTTIGQRSHLKGTQAIHLKGGELDG